MIGQHKQIKASLYQRLGKKKKKNTAEGGINLYIILSLFIEILFRSLLSHYFFSVFF